MRAAGNRKMHGEKWTKKRRILPKRALGRASSKNVAIFLGRKNVAIFLGHPVYGRTSYCLKAGEAPSQYSVPLAEFVARHSLFVNTICKHDPQTTQYWKY